MPNPPTLSGETKTEIEATTNITVIGQKKGLLKNFRKSICFLIKQIKNKISTMDSRKVIGIPNVLKRNKKLGNPAVIIYAPQIIICLCQIRVIFDRCL